MSLKKLRILFNVWADSHNVNAQSLNAREIALRLDPERFERALFYGEKPDPKLIGVEGIKLIRVPRRLGSLRILAEMLNGCDIVFYIQSDRASYMYLKSPRILRKNATSIFCVEGLIKGNLETVSPEVRSRFEYCVRACDVTSAVSAKIAEDCQECYGVRPRFVVPAGVDTRKFCPAASRTSEKSNVLFVGHLIERKGPMTVLTAAQRFRGAHFHLVGGPRGDYYKELHAAAERLGLCNVTFHGNIQQHSLAGLMRECDVFMLPSRVEGVPKVSLEAAASGLPCIVYDDYETPSVVNGVTGFQVKTENEMLDRLEELLSNPEKRKGMGREAARHAEQFDWDVITRKWEQIFENLAGGMAGSKRRSLVSSEEPVGGN